MEIANPINLIPGKSRARHKSPRETTVARPADIPRAGGKETVILQLLLDSAGKDLFGLEMVRLSDGGLKRGTIYVTLQRMEEKGLVESREEDRPAPEIGVARRLYIITGKGQRVLEAVEAAQNVLLSIPT